jgi:hypothetical protein
MELLLVKGIVHNVMVALVRNRTSPTGAVRFSPRSQTDTGHRTFYPIQFPVPR